MSESDVNEILSSLNVPPEKPTGLTETKTDSGGSSAKADDKNDKTATDAIKYKYVIPKDSQLYTVLKQKLPMMVLYSVEANTKMRNLSEADIPWSENGYEDLRDDWGLEYDAGTQNLYTDDLKIVVDRLQNKNAKDIISKATNNFRTIYGLAANAKGNRQKAVDALANVLNGYDGFEKVRTTTKQENVVDAWKKPTKGQLDGLVSNLQLVNKADESDIKVQSVKAKATRGVGVKQPLPTTEEQAQPTTEEQPQPAHELMPANINGNGENKIVINPQALNDLQTNQAQQLAATEAINTELLNTKHQLEQQQKILEEQNEILRAKDEFEKKLFQKKEIVRYIEGEGDFTFDELVNTVDDALSSKDKRADDFLIASAVQSILNKRDALEKLRDNERRKKSSQWSKAKIKDIRVEVQRDNNISPLMARTIASIS